MAAVGSVRHQYAHAVCCDSATKHARSLAIAHLLFSLLLTDAAAFVLEWTQASQRFDAACKVEGPADLASIILFKMDILALAGEPIADLSLAPTETAPRRHFALQNNSGMCP